MEMHSLAHKSGDMETKTPTEYYPSVTINDKQLPELNKLCKDKKVKDFPITATLVVEVRIDTPRSYGNGDTDYPIELRQATIKE